MGRMNLNDFRSSLSHGHSVQIELHGHVGQLIADHQRISLDEAERIVESLGETIREIRTGGAARPDPPAGDLRLLSHGAGALEGGYTHYCRIGTDESEMVILGHSTEEVLRVGARAVGA